MCPATYAAEPLKGLAALAPNVYPEATELKGRVSGYNARSGAIPQASRISFPDIQSSRRTERSVIDLETAIPKSAKKRSLSLIVG